MNTRPLGLALALVLAGCGSSKRPPAAASGASKPAAAPASTPATVKASPPEPEYAYSSVGKRDPFRSFLSEMAQESGTFSSRCSTPLGRFDIEQMKLVAVITGLEDPVAMVESPTGTGYTVRRGACIGKNGGVVAAVRSGEVVVSEWVVRADGSRDSTQTVLRLPKAVLNLEE
jgi:type IV pilus assembly protein PilP